MKPQTAILKFRTRINKLHSSDYDNIPDWIVVESINKSVLEIVRNCVSGNNQSKDGSEETIIRIDDLQHLLKPVELIGNNLKKNYFETDLPKDYLYWNRIIPFGRTKSCKNQILNTKLIEEANVPDYLRDWSTQPNWEWRQVFHTLLDDKLRIYKLPSFDIQKVDMVYYRKPIRFDIIGYVRETGEDSINSDLEFKEDICDIIIDNAVAITAGDIESLSQYQINKERKQTNI